ncbi:hypothetical protein B0H14DRAFT_2972333, partial [Mycena olivaceomarginata]
LALYTFGFLFLFFAYERPLVSRTKCVTFTKRNFKFQNRKTVFHAGARSRSSKKLLHADLSRYVSHAIHFLDDCLPV